MIPYKNVIYPSGGIQRKDPVHAVADRLSRQEVNLEWYLENAVDKPLFMYTSAHGDLGLDPWCLTDGVDRSDGFIDDDTVYWVWTETGREITVSPARRFFMQVADIEEII